LTGAKALRAVSAEPRKPAFVDPFQFSSPGLVTMSTEMNPGSCVSAANMLR
jgi:hypothetical protein